MISSHILLRRICTPHPPSLSRRCVFSVRAASKTVTAQSARLHPRQHNTDPRPPAPQLYSMTKIDYANGTHKDFSVEGVIAKADVVDVGGGKTSMEITLGPGFDWRKQVRPAHAAHPLRGEGRCIIPDARPYIQRRWGQSCRAARSGAPSTTLVSCALAR